MSGGGQPVSGSVGARPHPQGGRSLFGHAADPLLGKVLGGRYEIVAPLGSGGMAQVYRAIQHPLERLVAIKVLQPQFDTPTEGEFEKRFLFEASMTARLQHPNTVTVHDYGRSEDGLYFIAMELVEGETLQRVLKETGRLPWSRALALGAQVAGALRQAHQLGLIHRDLKPSNIMLLPDGEAVKVLDFGLVKSVEPLASTRGDGPSSISHASAVLGSPLYMSPEQIRGQADARSDIYSLGIVLFQAIAGRTPFSAENPMEILVQHLRQEPPQLRDLAEVPLDVNGLVMKCLEKRPDSRFQTMGELLEALRKAMEGMGPLGPAPTLGSFNSAPSLVGRTPKTASSVARETPPSVDESSIGPLSISDSFEAPPTSRLRRWVAGLAVGVAIALGAGVFLTRSSKSQLPPAALIAGAEPDHPLPSKPVDRAAPPVAEPAQVATASSTPPADKVVTFEITSEPSGAALSLKGKRMGKTPFKLTLPREGDGPVSIEIELSLQGYQPSTVAARGLWGVNTVHQVLTKAPLTARPALSAPSRGTARPATASPIRLHGYKGDPYD
jgi:serine/threonine protein kinase